MATTPNYSDALIQEGQRRFLECITESDELARASNWANGSPIRGQEVSAVILDEAGQFPPQAPLEQLLKEVAPALVEAICTAWCEDTSLPYTPRPYAEPLAARAVEVVCAVIKEAIEAQEEQCKKWTHHILAAEPEVSRNGSVYSSIAPTFWKEYFGDSLHNRFNRYSANPES